MCCVAPLWLGVVDSLTPEVDEAPNPLIVADPGSVALIVGLDILTEVLEALAELTTDVAGTTTVDRTVEVGGVVGVCAGDDGQFEACVFIGNVVGEIWAGVDVDVDSLAIMSCKAT